MQLGTHVKALCIAAALAAGATTAEAAPMSSQTGSAAAIQDDRVANEAEAFVQSKIDQGFAILNNRALNNDERRSKFAEFLRSIIDTRRVALFTLGPYARQASKGDIDNFVQAYGHFVTGLYESYFDRYSGENLRVAGSTRRSDDDVIVNANVVGRDGASQLKIGFRVRKGEDRKPILTDINIEGAWLGLNQRADFTSYLQQHGGMLAPLSSELESRAKRLEKREPAQRTS